MVFEYLSSVLSVHLYLKENQLFTPLLLHLVAQLHHRGHPPAISMVSATRQDED